MQIQQFNGYLREIYIPEIMMSPPHRAVHTIVEDVRAEYSHVYEIEYWPGPSKQDKMRRWVEDMNIPCTQVNRAWFFKTEEDRLLFMMVWS